jgi:glycosyltransferase involved in cell wall biosynthesis
MTVETRASTEGTEPVVARRVLSVIVPVYKNEATLPDLLTRLCEVAASLPVDTRVVFVVDGSPDGSVSLLRDALEHFRLPSTLVVLSRNFGAFAAIRAGLETADGDYFAVLAADLQEPPELLGAFVEQLETGDVDLVLGERRGRNDPFSARFSAGLFWWCYRRFVQPAMPPGGVDVFACNRAVRSTILRLTETNSSLVGQLLWIGFRRTTVSYDRQARENGKSAWTFRKKLRYMSDSIFSFTDLPIRLLLFIGFFGSLAVAVVAVVVLIAWMAGVVDVAGYTPLMLAVLAVGFVLTLGLGVVGSYLWRAFENTKNRPITITQSVEHFRGGTP